MKILHVLDHSAPLQSGYTFRTLSILRCQQALGIETVQLTSAKHYGANALEEDAEGFHFYRTPVEKQLIDRLPLLNQWGVVKSLQRRLLPLARELAPDVIHAHSPALNGIAAIRVGRQLGIPVLYEMRASWEDAAVNHGTTTEGSLRYRLSRNLESWVLRRADAITTIALGLKEDILSRGIPASKITLTPNAIDLEQFSTPPDGIEALRTQLGLDGHRVIGFIGSFYGYEGLDLLLDAFAGLQEQYPDTRLLLVGGGLQEEHLKQQCAELGIVDKVIFTGRVPHSDVGRYYRLIDIFAYPRHAMRLTELVTPLKPLEAMANHGVVVASDVGGHRELIDDGKTGLLFPAGSRDGLMGVIERILQQPELKQQLADNGRAFVESERNWRKTAEAYLPVYVDAVAGRIPVSNRYPVKLNSRSSEVESSQK